MFEFCARGRLADIRSLDDRSVGIDRVQPQWVVCCGFQVEIRRQRWYLPRRLSRKTLTDAMYLGIGQGLEHPYGWLCSTGVVYRQSDPLDVKPSLEIDAQRVAFRFGRDSEWHWL